MIYHLHDFSPGVAWDTQKLTLFARETASQSQFVLFHCNGIIHYGEYIVHTTRMHIKF